MSHPISEPARERRVNRASVSRVALFSHAPEAEGFEQRRPLAGDGVDWRSTPFSGRAAQQRRDVALDTRTDPAGHRRQAAGRPRVTTTQTPPVLP